MKFLKSTIPMLIILLFVVSCQGSNKNLKDGDYTAIGQGHNGPLTVQMQVSDSKISALEIIKHQETPGLSDSAIKNIPNEIIKNQSLAVDAISGATKVSEGIIEATADCIRQAGGDIEDFTKEIATAGGSNETIDKRTNVLVIGGGGSGLQAALRAKDEGAEVILIEKNSFLGGATILNGSNIVATGSKIGEKIFGDNGDSQQLLYEDLDKGSNYTVKKELTLLMTENIGKALDWVSEEVGLEYGKAQTQVADHSVNRQVELPSSSSSELINKISDHLRNIGVEILLDTRALDLLTNEGEVIGVRAINAEGNEVSIKADSVIIATGGYGADEQYRTEDMKGLLYYGPEYSTGDGLEMAMAVGADADNLDWYKIYPHGWEIEPGIGKLTTYSSKLATDMGAIYVNTSGDRILDESSVYSKFKAKILEQDDNIAYLVMDKATWDEFYKLLILHGFSETQVQGYLESDGVPIVVEANTIEEAAIAAGIDGESLKETVKDYNSFCQSGVDTEFAKPSNFLDPLDEGPFYIVEQKDRFATTLGGLIVNPDTMAVLDKNGSEIPNLFAAGEVVGGANGNDSLPSCMNSWSLASAYVAGAAAAENIR